MKMNGISFFGMKKMDLYNQLNTIDFGECPKSPNKQHCWHQRYVPYLRTPSMEFPYSQYLASGWENYCCWCGPEEVQHGPFIKQ